MTQKEYYEAFPNRNDPGYWEWRRSKGLSCEDEVHWIPDWLRKRYLEEHPEMKAEGFGFWCLKCGCCRYCLCSLPSICGTCAYCWCVFIPCGRFCPGRCACLPSCCPGKSCKAMDSFLLSQESMGPGWVSPMRERFKDDEEEDEEEGAQ